MLDAEAAAAFERLAHTPKKELCRWVAEAKREATRLRRAAKAVEMLCRGERLSRGSRRTGPKGAGTRAPVRS